MISKICKSLVSGQ